MKNKNNSIYSNIHKYPKSINNNNCIELINEF